MKAIRKIFGLIGLSIGAVLFTQSNSALGQSVTVLVGSGGLKFFPATASIPVNGSVIWSWSGSDHSTTSGTPPGTPNGLWNSGVNNSPHSFTNTFNSSGTFPYYCSIHFGEGMVGNIIVTNSAVPPVVTITNPASGTVLSAPASLKLTASANVASGNVTNVEFLQGASSLGNVAAAPFSVQVNNLTAGAYTSSAIATADSGLTATNSVSVSVINASPLILTSPTVSAPAQFTFKFSSDVGLTYVVQVSTNLSIGWTSIATNTAITDPTVFTAPNGASAGSFYQVFRLPNP